MNVQRDRSRSAPISCGSGIVNWLEVLKEGQLFPQHIVSIEIRSIELLSVMELTERIWRFKPGRVGGSDGSSRLSPLRSDVHLLARSPSRLPLSSLEDGTHSVVQSSSVEI